MKNRLQKLATENNRSKLWVHAMAHQYVNAGLVNSYEEAISYMESL